MSATDEQIAFWNGAAGERWVREQAERDAMLAAYGDATIAAAHVADGDAILDVGCGCGTTSIALARRVGPRGRVLGVDISAPMVARARDVAAGAANVAFVVADATTEPLEAGAYDVVFSRFGVMFFGEPATAFANLRRASKRGGRVAFVCWRRPEENPWAWLPFQAAIAELGAPPPPAPNAPGPFAFADGARVAVILDRAGFASVDVAPFETSARYGATLDEAVPRFLTMGPAARRLADAAPDVVARVVARTREAMAGYASDAGVVVPGAVWIVTARAP